jgi:hypothetical protein
VTVPVTPDGTYTTADDCPEGHRCTTHEPVEPVVFDTHEDEVPCACRLPVCWMV